MDGPAAPEQLLAGVGASTRTVQPATPKPLPLMFFQDIEPDLSVSDFVQGVLEEQSSIVVYGESNAGKTFWVTDLSLHAAAGKRWNDRRVDQCGVIYCILEGGQAFKNRVAAWKSEHGLEDARIPFAAIPASLNLLLPDADTPRLIDAIRRAADHLSTPVKLVVIDTLSRALAGGNESASEDMGALLKNMDRIREETEASVLFIHHSGKDQARGARGWSGLKGSIDTEIEVTASEATGTRQAEVTKQRNMAKGDVFPFTLHPVVLGKNQHGEDKTTCVVRTPDNGAASVTKARAGKPLNQTSQRALAYLADLIIGEGRPLPTGSDWPLQPDIRAVPTDRWHDECVSRGISTAKKPDDKRRAVERVTKDVLNAGHAVVREGLAWLPPTGLRS